MMIPLTQAEQELIDEARGAAQTGELLREAAAQYEFAVLQCRTCQDFVNYERRLEGDRFSRARLDEALHQLAEAEAARSRAHARWSPLYVASLREEHQRTRPVLSQLSLFGDSL
jgi:hypothetical protein